MKFKNIEVDANIYGIKAVNSDGTNKTTPILVRTHVGDVSENDYGVRSFSYSMNYSPIVEFSDGKMINISWNSLIDMAINIKKKYEKGEHEEKSE